MDTFSHIFEVCWSVFFIIFSPRYMEYELYFHQYGSLESLVLPVFFLIASLASSSKPLYIVPK